MSEATMARLRPGMRLLNGARYLDSTSDGHYTYVLALIVNGDDTLPFVTWAYDPATGATFWGHYYNTLAEGVADLAARAKR